MRFSHSLYSSSPSLLHLTSLQTDLFRVSFKRDGLICREQGGLSKTSCASCHTAAMTDNAKSITTLDIVLYFFPGAYWFELVQVMRATCQNKSRTQMDQIWFSIKKRLKVHWKVYILYPFQTVPPCCFDLIRSSGRNRQMLFEHGVQ